MNFGLTDEQQMLRDSFARLLDAESGPARFRRAGESAGFDPVLWRGLAELGTLAMRVAEDHGGLDLGTLEACIALEEAGRRLASGPIAETIVAARLLSRLEQAPAELLGSVLDGSKVVTLALHDIAWQQVQWVAGGAMPMPCSAAAAMTSCWPS